MNSIAELKALNTLLVDDGESLYASGYYSSHDGGGGIFHYDKNSSEADDGGSVIEPDSGIGRFIRVIEGPVSIKWFGALGDGVTDNTAAMQAAIDYKYNNGGGAVVIPPGTYISGQLMLRHGVRIEGESFSGFNGIGPESTSCKVQLKAGSNESLILIPINRTPLADYPYNVWCTSSVGVFNLWLDGNKANQTGTSHCIEFEDTLGVLNPNGDTTIGSDTLTSVSSTTGIKIGAPITGTGIPSGAYVVSVGVDSIVMSEVATATNATNPVWISNISIDSHDSDSAISRCYITNALSDGLHISAAFRAVRVFETTIMDCTGNGIRIQASDCRVVASMSQRNTGHGVLLTSAANKFVGCDFSTNENNIHIEVGEYGANGNVFAACGMDRSYKDNIYIEDACKGMIFTSCRLSGASKESPGSYVNFNDRNVDGGNVLAGCTLTNDDTIVYPLYHIDTPAFGFVSCYGCVFIASTTTSGDVADDLAKLRTPATSGDFWMNGSDALIWQNDTNVYRHTAGLVRTDGKFIGVAGLGAGNSAAATTLGSVTKKMQVFDHNGASLGYVAIYDAIT